MENKKIKLTVSGTAKKSFKNIDISKTKNKNSVIIEKNPSKFIKKASLSKPSSGGFKSKSLVALNGKKSRFTVCYY